MRKLLPLIALAAVFVLAAPAAAKTGVSLDSTPDGLSPGQAWDVTITPVFHEPNNPQPPGPKGISIKSQESGRTIHFRAKRVKGGDYRAHVVFPSEGTWVYRVTGFGIPSEMQQDFAPVFITNPPPPRTPAKSGGGDDFPLAAVLGGLGGLLVLGLGAFAIRRARVRPASS
jgi:hypothetical protein